LEGISIIKWGNRYIDSYSYGAEVVIDKKETKFASPMMPVGAKIKTWNSIGNYSKNRISPLLPLLAANQYYEIGLYLEEAEQNHLQATIEFYDKFNNKIGMEYFENLKLVFKYPEEAASYKISLINQRHDVIVFYFLLIMNSSFKEKYELLINKKIGILELASHKIDESNEKLEIVINYLLRETSVIPLSNDKENRLCLFVNRGEDDFLKFLMNVLKYMKNGTKEVFISQGQNFEFLSRPYQLLPNILSSLFPSHNILSNIQSQESGQNDREIRKYVYIAQQMQQRISDVSN